MPVAKTYANWKTVSEVFVANGRQYINVESPKGSTKTVRWYTDKEYAKMYPDAAPVETEPKWKPQREILGFQKGYITIFKGDTYAHLDWFRASIARYHKIWGWYIVSTEEIPADLPAEVTPVELLWESVGGDNGELKADHIVKTAVEALLYEEGTSEWVGSVGERLDLMVTVKQNRSIDNGYSISTMHTMEDSSGNVYVWFTSAKSWPEGMTKHIRGTVKEHSVFRNVKQTVLTRCTEVK
jgi:hypothetical protein